MVKLTESIISGRTKVSALDMVRKLNCWGCDLDDIEILQQMPNVEVLSLSVNNIDTLWPLSGCTNLRELYLRKNNISELGELRHLRRLSNLRILWLSENPCADHPNYRHYVLRILPSLTTLDNRSVTTDELNAVTTYDQCNDDAGGMSAINANESSPECDLPAHEITGCNGGIGWQTVRIHRPLDEGSKRSFDADRPNNGFENGVGMSTSCYAPNPSVDASGFGVGRPERQSAWTSMHSLYDSPHERNGFVNESVCWQQSPQQNQPQQRGAACRQSVPNTNQSNILVAIFALFNELDSRGLESVINEAEQRLQRM